MSALCTESNQPTSVSAKSSSNLKFDVNLEEDQDKRDTNYVECDQLEDSRNIYSSNSERWTLRDELSGTNRGRREKNGKKEKHGGIYSVLSKKDMVISRKDDDSWKDFHDESDHCKYDYVNNYICDQIKSYEHSGSWDGEFVEYTDELSLRPQTMEKETRLSEISRPKGQKRSPVEKKVQKVTRQPPSKKETQSVINEAGNEPSSYNSAAQSRTVLSNSLDSTLAGMSTNESEHFPRKLPIDSANSGTGEVPEDNASIIIKSSLKNLKSGLGRRRSAVSSSIDNFSDITTPNSTSPTEVVVEDQTTPAVAVPIEAPASTDKNANPVSVTSTSAKWRYSSTITTLSLLSKLSFCYTPHSIGIRASNFEMLF